MLPVSFPFLMSEDTGLSFVCGSGLSFNNWFRSARRSSYDGYRQTMVTGTGDRTLNVIAFIAVGWHPNNKSDPREMCMKVHSASDSDASSPSATAHHRTARLAFILVIQVFSRIRPKWGTITVFPPFHDDT